MKREERGFVVQVLIALIAVFVSSGVYLFIYSQNREARVQAKLESAREKAAAETQKLDDLKKEFRDTYPLHVAIQDQYAKVIEVMFTVDILFDTSDSAHPDIKLKTKNSAVETTINAKRALIETMLEEWKQKAAIALATQTNTATLNSIQESANVIQSFINELASIVDALTPANSDLSQSEIDSYANTLSEATEEIHNIVAALEAAESANTSSASSTTASVTLAQIETQEEVVTQAQVEVALLEEELEEIQASDNTPAEEPGLDEQPEGDVAQEDESSSESEVDYTAEDPLSDPIIVVPGPPRLIQGANKN